MVSLQSPKYSLCREVGKEFKIIPLYCTMYILLLLYKGWIFSVKVLKIKMISDLFLKKLLIWIKYVKKERESVCVQKSCTQSHLNLLKTAMTTCCLGIFKDFNLCITIRHTFFIDPVQLSGQLAGLIQHFHNL